MKELILALVGVVIIALIMEMFCPQNHLKSVIMSAFSLVTIFVILSGLKSFIGKDYKTNYNLNENITYSLEIISESSTKYMEEQILNVCKKEGVDNIVSVELEAEINSLSIRFFKAKIVLKNKYNETKIKEIVQKIIPSINEEDILII